MRRLILACCLSVAVTAATCSQWVTSAQPVQSIEVATLATQFDTAQLTAFKAAILAETDPIIVQAVADGANGTIANWYNLDASPDYWLFREQVSNEEVMHEIDIQDAANITTADLERVLGILEIRASEGYSGANARDRSAWDDVFSSAAGDNSQQAIAVLWTRLASNAEVVFSLSTGSGANTANADTTSWQGVVTSGDVIAALNL